MGEERALPSLASDVKIVKPENNLKKLIGEDVDLRKVFSAENIEKAQEVISAQAENFLEWVKEDLNRLEDCYQSAQQDVAASKPWVSKLAHTAFIIKSQAGTFGYPLATKVAKSLDDFCNKDFTERSEHLLVIRKHIDTLQMIFAKRVQGDGDDIGGELLANLERLITKYR